MIDPREYERANAWLEAHERALLVSHRKPDGDALGALAAMSMLLQAQGKVPTIALFEPFPPRYRLLCDNVNWEQWSEIGVTQRDFDALVVVDTCAFGQLEPMAEYFNSPPATLVVDHHATRDDIGAREGDRRLLDVSASATCLILAEWLVAVGEKIDACMATALFLGIGTDTGWFRFPCADARTLRVAAGLMECGADNNAIYRAVYENEPRAKMALIGRLLSNVEYVADGRIAVLTLTSADFKATGADESMSEDLVNEIGRAAGLEGTVMFTATEDGVVRLNFRSKTMLNVAELARQFGGGGHERAAGARIKGTMDSVKRKVLTAAQKALKP